MKQLEIQKTKDKYIEYIIKGEYKKLMKLGDEDEIKAIQDKLTRAIRLLEIKLELLKTNNRWLIKYVAEDMKTVPEECVEDYNIIVTEYFQNKAFSIAEHIGPMLGVSMLMVEEPLGELICPSGLTKLGKEYYKKYYEDGEQEI